MVKCWWLKRESGEPQAAQSFKVPLGNLIFEQQKEFLLLQLAHEKDKQRMEMERQKMEFEKQVAIERLCCETEQAKTDLQATRLGLLKEGKLSGEVWRGGDGSSSPSKSPDVVSSLCLLPKFNESFFLCLSGWQKQEAGQILTKHCCCGAC